VGTQLILDVLGRAEAAGEPAVMVQGIPGYQLPGYNPLGY
jgi:predicted N-acetyltransferase YhbS